LACETDFVAKNDTFRNLATQIVDQLSKEEDFASFALLADAVKESVNTILKDNFVTIGENMQILDAFVATGNAYVYRHPGDRKASVVFYTGDESAAKEVALQVTAMNPLYLSVQDVPVETVNELTAMFSAELKDSNKPADIIEKIVAGKLAKEWWDLVLLEQTSIVDDTKKIKDRLGATVVHKYIRYSI
jgi:elongation factor Ts